MMVDKYFNFAWDSVYHFEDRHGKCSLIEMVMDGVFKLRSDLIKMQEACTVFWS